MTACPLCRQPMPAAPPPPPRTAVEKFVLGQRVHLVEWPGNARGERSGVVIAFCRRVTNVRVLRDGQKNPDTWHMDQWEAVPA